MTETTVNLISASTFHSDVEPDDEGLTVIPSQVEFHPELETENAVKNLLLSEGKRTIKNLPEINKDDHKVTDRQVIEVSMPTFAELVKLNEDEVPIQPLPLLSPLNSPVIHVSPRRIEPFRGQKLDQRKCDIGKIVRKKKESPLEVSSGVQADVSVNAESSQKRQKVASEVKSEPKMENGSFRIPLKRTENQSSPSRLSLIHI